VSFAIATINNKMMSRTTGMLSQSRQTMRLQRA